MLFMNEFDIEEAQARWATHPTLGPATRFLARFAAEVNAHSDGWPYWSLPVKSAAKLMTVIQDANTRWRDGRSVETSAEDVRQALVPIKAFMTRRGTAAGMRLPDLR